MPEIEIRRELQGRTLHVELLVDGDRASGLVAHDMQMRIGDVPVRCGGIGGVNTSPRYRMNGYARRVMEGALAYMREEQYQLAALFGIPDFYGQFGFVPALVRSEWSVLTRYAEAAQPHFPVREFAPEDAPAVLEIYASLRGDQSGSIVRDPATWTGFVKGATWTSRVGAYVVIDGGQIIGYASYNLDPHRFAISEIGWRDPRVLETIVAEAARRAIAMRLEKIPFHGPVDDTFARYCRRYGAEIKVEYQRSSWGMVRIVDQTSLLEKVNANILGVVLNNVQLDSSLYQYYSQR